MKKEKFPIEILSAKIFMICICDIKPEEAAIHRRHYGNYAVVLRKSWGIEHGVTPVQYIHKNSLPKSPNYWEMKALFGDVIIEAQQGNDKLVMMLLIKSLLIDKLKKQHSITDAQYGAIKADLEEGFKKTISSLTLEQGQAFANYLSSLFNRLMTFNALFERRNAYLKAYEGELAKEGGASGTKVFYDEREWRAVRFITVKDRIEDKNYYDRAIRERQLPDECNLKFTNADIIAVLVEDEESVEEIREFICTQETLLNYESVKDKIHPIYQFSEKT